MRRAGVVVVVTLMAAVVLWPSVGATAAPAVRAQQLTCIVEPPGDYPPVGQAPSTEVGVVLVSGRFDPGGQGTMRLAGAIAGDLYDGIVFAATPIVLPEVAADGATNLTFDMPVPADFELGAVHHVELCNAHVLAASLEMCVTFAGDLAPVSACSAESAQARALPRTGLDHLLEALRWAALLIAVGAAIAYAGRRRREASRTN